MLVRDLSTVHPSFVRGFARVLDLGGTLDEYDIDVVSVKVSDASTLAADRERLRQDIFRAYLRARSRLEEAEQVPAGI